MSITNSPCWQCNICVGVQQLFMCICMHISTPNYSCQTLHEIRNFSSFFLPTLAPWTQSATFAHSAIPSPPPLIHLPPLCSVSPSHTLQFTPSNYNSINQSFAVTMATATLGTGPCVACGHQPATDHHHLLHQNKVNLSSLNGLQEPRGRLCGVATWDTGPIIILL